MSDAKRPLKTLERVISKAGLGSRTEARRWIHAGRVTVNGAVIENPDHWVDMARDRVGFDGRPLQARERLYVLLHKPTGYLTTYKDPQGRPTVYQLITEVGTFVSPVGRLDLDTSGLLLLTNDTQLAERVTNPDSHVTKTYQVTASRLLSDAELAQLRAGVLLDDGPTRPAGVARVRDAEGCTQFEITLTEGRNRQVRRMVEALGAQVLTLVRVRIGSIGLGGLPAGDWRPLTPREVASLRGDGGGRTARGQARASAIPAPAITERRPARAAQRPADAPSRDRGPGPAGGAGRERRPVRRAGRAGRPRR